MADRCHFIRIYYSLITRPDLPPSLFEPFGSICNQLLKKSWKLQHQQQNGGCDDLDETRLLVLEWRPLFEVIKSHFYPKSRDRVLPGVAQAVQSVYSVVHRARR